MRTGFAPPLGLLGFAVLLLTGLMASAPEVQNRPHTNNATGSAKADDGWRAVTIRAQVPESTGTVYLTGNRPELGNWNPRGFAMTGPGRERLAGLRLPLGTQLEYKFTLGSWDRAGLGPSGTVLPNHRLPLSRRTPHDLTKTSAPYPCRSLESAWPGRRSSRPDSRWG